MNLLDCRINSKVYMSIEFPNISITMIKKPIRVSKSNATVIDQVTEQFISYNKFFNCNSSNWDFWPLSNKFWRQMNKPWRILKIQKGIFNEESIIYFMETLYEKLIGHIFTISPTEIKHMVIFWILLAVGKVMIFQ